jgi:hypothetical protein
MVTDMKNLTLIRALSALLLAALCSIAIAQDKQVQDKQAQDSQAQVSKATVAEAEAISTSPVLEEVHKGVTHQMWRKSLLGELKIGADSNAAEALVLGLDIPINYAYISTLMRTPNAFGEGPACVVCHSSNDAQRSYRGLDLTSCEGILRGATEKPVGPIIVPGEPLKSKLVMKLRNNRMPLGIPFLSPTNTESIQKVKDWIDSGAHDDDNFKQNVLPLFHDEKAFGSDVACMSCHSSHRDPPSFNEVNFQDYDSIMKGAFSKTRNKEGKPGIPIVIPFNAQSSSLYQRLTENRMPPGMSPNEDSDHINVRLLMRWIEQGAWCK